MSTEVEHTSANALASLRIALVHDYLIKIGGAEKVLDALHELFPQAPVYTLLYDEKQTGGRYRTWDIRPSWLDRAWAKKRLVDYYRALMPQATESLDLTDYDVVISDASSFVKGAITQPHTLHLSYIHTPTRFLWFDVDSHVQRSGFGGMVKRIVPAVLHRIRMWDYIAAQRPDFMIANSRLTQSRIKKFYRRDAEILYPPVDVSRFDHRKRKPDDYFLIISRLEPHKEIETVIRACNEAELPLVIVGTGTKEQELRRIAGPTIRFVGHVSDAERDKLLYSARAFVALQVEDFGISLVEALAAGCPVIARNAGGATEIVIDNKTGILMDSVSIDDVIAALISFDGTQCDSLVCYNSAVVFDKHNFKHHITLTLTKHLSERNRHGVA